MMKRLTTILMILTVVVPLFAKTIAEKKASVSDQVTDLSPELQRALVQSNTTIDEQHIKLQTLYRQINDLFTQGASADAYKILLDQINSVRGQIQVTQDEWRKTAKIGAQDGYALWHQPDTTIGQLVIDYGSQDFVYLLSPEISQMKISVSSNLPIPTASWDEMMELILTQSGVGVKKLNPYLRQLYLIKNDRSQLQVITNNRNDLHLLPPNARIAFVFSPEPADARRIWIFLEKFVNPNSTAMQMVGRDIFIVAPVEEIQDLLKLYDFVATNRGDKEYKVVALNRVNAEEMAKILSAIFEQFNVAPPVLNTKEKMRRAEAPPTELTGLRVITLGHIAQAVFLVGTQEEIKKAEEIIREVECQVGGAKEKVIHWYTVRHSDPEDLAKVLSKIYALMAKTKADKEVQSCPIEDIDSALAELQAQETEMTGLLEPFPPRNIFDYGYYLDDRYVVNDSADIDRAKDPNKNRNNFIVDPKSNSIVMVVEASLLPQMKDLMRKLDVPKKMVQLEVLLFEKRLRRETDFGLNLLKVGNCASDTHSSCASWNDKHNRGVFEYLLSRKQTCSGLPAFDLIYRFLMTQDDITINATPSVIALNQTPAIINVEDEISVNTGIFEIPTEGAVALKDSFARARYGIKIKITPTVHAGEENSDGDENAYVTMDTDVIFETIHKKTFNPKQPDVTRRVIKNQVRVADGETVILGGLRRKVTEDKKEMIPFVGELPGIGKLFSMTEMEDCSTEMYIFITPTIVYNADEDLIRVRTRELCRRPGDIPCFLANLVRARECEKNRLMRGAMDMLLGRLPERIEVPCGEFDGRCTSCN